MMTDAAAASATAFFNNLKSCLLFFCSRGDYFFDLENDLKSLKDEKDRLKTKKERVEENAKRDKTLDFHHISTINDWLSKAATKLKAAEDIIKEGEDELQHKCLRWFCPNIRHCFSYDKVGKTVNKILKEVSSEIDEAKFDSVFVRMSLQPVIEMAVGGPIIGLDDKFKEIWGCVEHSTHKIIGLHGPLGVGKTILLKQINNNFRRNGLGVGVVIWVSVSKGGDVGNVQEAIRKRLEIPDKEWTNKTVDERANLIRDFLRTIKFVLLLDDLSDKSNFEGWEQSDIENVGVPIDGNDNGSKIIFTARSIDVCTAMSTDKMIKVERPDHEDAKKLFLAFVGDETVKAYSKIPELADTLVESIKRVPKYLVAMGKVMAGRTNHLIWQHAVNAVQSKNSSSSKQSLTIEQKFFQFLKFFYECLSNETIKTCFLYCSVYYKQGQKIEKSELISLWIEDRLFCDCDDELDAYDEGRSVIEKLKLARLLEETPDSVDFVKVPDVVYEMAMQVASEQKLMKRSFSGSSYKMVEAGASLLLTYTR